MRPSATLARLITSKNQLETAITHTGAVHRRPGLRSMASPNVSANRAALAGDGEDRRAQILRVSAELFAERGYASTTVRNIAERTGLLSGSLYHHFDSKESILQEILTDFFDELTQRVQRAIEEAGDDPAVAFRKL